MRVLSVYPVMRLAWCVAVVCAAAAQRPGGQPVSPTKPAPRPAQLSGTAVSAAAGEPVRKAAVRLAGLANYEFTTDASGAFRFSEVAPGRYRLSAEKAGFVAGTSTITLAEGEHATGQVIKLTPQGVITGRVTDEDGDPVQGASVQLLRGRYVNGRKQLVPEHGGTTNDLGEYRVAGIRPGRYWLSAQKMSNHWSREMLSPPGGSGPAPLPSTPEQGYVPAYYPGASAPAEAAALAITPSLELRGIDLQLHKEPTYRVRGRVLGLEASGSEGRPWGSVHVMLMPSGPAVPAFSMGMRPVPVSPRDGSFVVSNVARGDYMLIASQNQGASQRSGRLPVQVGGGHVDGVEVALQASITLEGTVKVEGSSEVSLNSVRVELQAWEGWQIFGASGASASKGRFRIPGLAPLRYRVSVRGVPEDVYVRSVRYGEQEAAAKGVDLPAGAAGPLEVILATGAPSIQGTVRDSRGEAAPNMTVTLIPEGDPVWPMDLYRTAQTGQGGEFLIAGLRPGAYRVLAWEEIEPGAHQDPEFVKPFEADGARIKLEAGSRETVQLKAIRKP